ncbi:MAG: hypothetical protein GY865_02055 [candidate division Zixibacteria bacterium]|nr:hypothetical protein [candidate division Zixibacteria bacterium]
MKTDFAITEQDYSNLKKEQYFNNWDISPVLCNPLLKILKQRKPVSTLFGEMTNKLSKFFSISKAALILKDMDKETLAVTAVWKNFQFNNGLKLTLPRKNSFLYEILNTRKIKSLPIFSKAPGNMIENKIIINKSDSALTVCPMISEDLIRGLISFASPIPYAFEMIEEGYLGTVFETFGQVLSDEYEKTNRKKYVEGEWE